MSINEEGIFDIFSIRKHTLKICFLSTCEIIFARVVFEFLEKWKQN